MTLPVNFDSVGVDAILADWVIALREYGVDAVLVLGPDPDAGRDFASRTEAAELAWSALNIWPMLRRAIAETRVTLSPRELESLQLAFEGLTARETALRMDCAERTVNYHLANAMAKLHTDNKLQAVQKACWLGLI